VRGDACCLSKQQQSVGQRRTAAAAPIRRGANDRVVAGSLKRRCPGIDHFRTLADFAPRNAPARYTAAELSEICRPF
jgi:hypothetical protein